MFVNDIGDNLSSKTKLRLFADDTVLYRSITSENEARILQNDLTNLFLWASKWNLKFNVKKCNLMRFYRATSLIREESPASITLRSSFNPPHGGILTSLVSLLEQLGIGII